MKRKELKEGQRYAAYTNNKSKGSSYLTNRNRGVDYIVEVVDVRPFRSTGGGWTYHSYSLEGAMERMNEYYPDYDSGSYRNVLVKIEGMSGDRYFLCPLSYIKMPWTVWKRKGVVRAAAERKREIEAEETRKLNEAVGRRWNKTTGKKIRNKIRKLEKKAGVEAGSLVATRGNQDSPYRIYRETDLFYRSYNRKGAITLDADAFLKLLEAI